MQPPKDICLWHFAVVKCIAAAKMAEITAKCETNHNSAFAKSQNQSYKVV
jgi:hypothetical protein